MNKNLKDQSLAAMDREELVKVLAEAYDEAPEEFAEVARKMKLATKFCRDLGMTDGQTWATMVRSSAEALGLDLDNEAGMAAAGMLAYYQMQD